MTRLRAAVAALVVAGGSVVALGAPAQATGTLKFCVNDNYGRYCETRVTYDSDLKNDCYEWLPGETAKDAKCQFLTYNIHSLNDKISSVKNSGRYWWKLYEDVHYGGYVLCLRPHGYDKDLGNNTPVEDDISSLKRQGTKRPSGCDQVIG